MNGKRILMSHAFDYLGLSISSTGSTVTSLLPRPSIHREGMPSSGYLHFEVKSDPLYGHTVTVVRRLQAASAALRSLITSSDASHEHLRSSQMFVRGMYIGHARLV